MEYKKPVNMDKFIDSIIDRLSEAMSVPIDELLKECIPLPMTKEEKDWFDSLPSMKSIKKANDGKIPESIGIEIIKGSRRHEGINTPVNGMAFKVERTISDEDYNQMCGRAVRKPPPYEFINVLNSRTSPFKAEKTVYMNSVQCGNTFSNLESMGIDPEEDIPVSQFDAAMMETDDSGRVLHGLKAKLKLTINMMVQRKPRGWQDKKSAYADVLTMIKNLESE